MPSTSSMSSTSYTVNPSTKVPPCFTRYLHCTLAFSVDEHDLGIGGKLQQLKVHASRPGSLLYLTILELCYTTYCKVRWLKPGSWVYLRSSTPPCCLLVLGAGWVVLASGGIYHKDVGEHAMLPYVPGFWNQVPGSWNNPFQSSKFSVFL